MEQKDIRNKGLRDNEIIHDAIIRILNQIGEDPYREGLKRTPYRFAKACEEWFGGYRIDPKEVMDRVFPSEGYDDMVVMKDIGFYSFCEHHIAPFMGNVHIGVIYQDKILGLDKYAKLVDVFARRLQTQEVMTKQIGEAIKEVLEPRGIIIVIEAKHLCVGSRETKNQTMSFTTTYRHGVFLTDKRLESRFLEYIS